MTATLREKNDRYHVILSWQQNGKRMQKSVATGIPVQGNNKRKAEAARKSILGEWETRITGNFTDILFSDYLLQWLESMKHSIAETTYHSYKNTIEKSICPYFAERRIKLHDLKAYHIQDFYTWMLTKSKVSANTIHHYHANIHKALRNAYEMERIAENPASKVTLPQKGKFKGAYYTPDELKSLIEVVKGTKLEVPLMLVSWFGMRRGEIVGCRWDAINFETKTLYMCGTVTDKGDGTRKENLVYRNLGKTPASIRTFPLTDGMVSYFKELKKRQVENRLLAGSEYNTQWLDFICVDEVGDLITLEYISCSFNRVLAKHGLRHIRFHDLRHTNATLLLEEGATLKELQDWMGHKSMATTADIYSHVQHKAKRRLSESISNLLADEPGTVG